MTAYYPVSIVTHGLALNVTIHSYAGMLDYGFIAAKDEVPKLDRLAGMLADAHAELLALIPALVVSNAPAKKVAKPTLTAKARVAKIRIKPKTSSAKTNKSVAKKSR
jgi:hypothetical protein